MSLSNFTPPQFYKNNFICPHCNTYSNMKWEHIGENDWSVIKNLFNTETTQKYSYGSAGIYVCTPDCCKNRSYWLGHKEQYQSINTKLHGQGLMIWPNLSTAEHAHEDMPLDIKKDYEEARQVVGISPRAAVALLRLALQKLLAELGGTTGKIDGDIGELVANCTLSKRLEKMSDILRVAGNNSVHPDKIGLNLDGNPELVSVLFRLINTIVEEAITAPQALDDLYDLIPPNLKDGIETRNQRAIEKVAQTPQPE